MQPDDPKRQFALEIVRRLRRAGYISYWAGGCVRDEVLGLVPKDYDVVTNARPDDIRRLFGFRRTLAIGAAFGVISVLGSPGEGQVDVATFRQDSAYSDGRHPDSVTFSSPEADARRRDFTINGLFYDPIDNQVIDFVGGLDDLKRGLVRAIGDPEARFSEDKLRMLRAVRFAATFAFTLDEGTAMAIRPMAAQIVVVSAERITAELERMFVHHRRARALELLHDTGLLAALLPEVQESLCRQTIEHDPNGENILSAVQRLLHHLKEPDFATAFAGLLAPLSSASQLPAICRRMRLSRQQTKKILWLARHFDYLWSALRLPWPKLQRVLVDPYSSDLVMLHEAQLAAGWTRPSEALQACRARLSWPRERLNPPPLISGDDLVRLGVQRGQIYRRLLDMVRDAQLDGHISSRDEALRLVRAELDR